MPSALSKAIGFLVRKPTWLWTPLACATFIVLCSLRVIPALTVFTSAPINGAFQLFNPLKRLANGEMLTRDFDFFHGAGTLLIHYPIFSWFGGDLFASELSRHLLSPAAFLLCFLVVGMAFRMPLWFAGLGAAVTFALGDFLKLGSGAVCGNSMIGLRSTVPVLAIPIAMLLARASPVFKNAVVFHATVGTVLGLGIFIATEQGLASFAIHLMVLALIPESAFRFSSWLANLGVMVLAFIAAYGILIGISTDWRIAETLRFSLLDLTRDQFWYYGAPPNPVPDWFSLPKSREIVLGFWAPLGFLLAELAVVSKSVGGFRKPAPLSVFIIILLAVSMTVQLLHLATYSHYHFISFRNMGVVAMLWLHRLASRQRLSERITRGPFGRPAIKLILPLLAFIAFAAQRATVVAATVENKANQYGSGTFHGGIRISLDWQEDLTAWRRLATPGTTVSGTYRSIADDFSPSAFKGPDYIIHSLGSKRPQFLSSLEFQNPDCFHTINPHYSSYEEWLQVRNWDVYLHLHRHYQPVATSSYHVFWKHRDAVPDRSDFRLDPLPHENGMWLSSRHEGRKALFLVSVEYETHNPLASVPFFGKIPRYFIGRTVVGSSGALIERIACSLPPHETQWSFPIVLADGESARFDPRTVMPTPGAGFTIKTISMAALTSDPAYIDALTGSNETSLYPSPKMHDHSK